MIKPIPLFIGLRYTGAKRRNHFISFISMTSVLGLTLGVAVLIVVLSVMNGFDRELQNRILGMVPHGSINANMPIDDWEQLLPKLAEQSKVLAAAPYSQMQGLLSSNGNVAGALVTGILPQYEKNVSILGDFLVQGGLEDLEGRSYRIILGRTLAMQLGVGVGDKVTLVLPEAMVTPAGLLPRYKRFTVSGIFEVGAELDGVLATIHLDDAAKLLREPESVQSIRVKLDDLFSANTVMSQLAQQLNASAALGKNDKREFTATDWTYTHGNLFNAIKMEKYMIGFLLMLIVAVAAFNIVASLVMLVREKHSDIAILRTMGASSSDIRNIFIFQGMLIGLIGTLVGAGLGVLVALTISDFTNWIDQTLQLNIFSSYFINYLPTELRMSHVLLITGVAFGLTVVATIYPANKAAKVQPAEALRYE